MAYVKSSSMAEEIVPDEENPMLLKHDDIEHDNSSLFPEITEEYVKKHNLEFEKKKNIFEKYRDAKIKPFVFVKNIEDKKKPELVYGIGLDFKF